MGEHFQLSHEGKAAIALFLLAGTWWVFEVVPIGITSLAIGAFQALFLIRPAENAFKDFMDPSVLFIFGSLVIGMVSTKVGLSRRLSYKMLTIVGERTSMITLLGAARAAVAIGFFNDIVERDVSFFELSFYMLPIGWLMLFLCWAMMMWLFKPEKSEIQGLREKARTLYKEAGPITRDEMFVALIVLAVIVTLSLKSFIPAMAFIDKTSVILLSTIIFFIFKILTIKELEQIPWNIILLFAGAMSIGFCLWERRSQVVGDQLAGHVSGVPLVCFCDGYFFFYYGYDQLHYECCRHCHFITGRPGYLTLSGGFAGCRLIFRPGRRCLSISAIGRSRRPMPLPMIPNSSLQGSFL